MLTLSDTRNAGWFLSSPAQRYRLLLSEAEHSAGPRGRTGHTANHLFLPGRLNQDASAAVRRPVRGPVRDRPRDADRRRRGVAALARRAPDLSRAGILDEGRGDILRRHSRG